MATIMQCPPECRESNRVSLPAQRPVRAQRSKRREFIPVGLLAVIRILARRTNGEHGDRHPIIFREEAQNYGSKL